MLGPSDIVLTRPSSPQELFPLKPSKSVEALPVFDEGPSSMIPSMQGEQREIEHAVQRFKGVVQQQNGHWGAQIYGQQNRIWLGTFKSELAAARAYDSAATKFHRGDSHRNFPLTEATVHEPDFQNHFTSKAIVDMLRDGSYEHKFIEFVRTVYSGGIGTAVLPAAPAAIGGVILTELFQKELTPSDVGKLNRLVIPKKHATLYFPPVRPDAMEELLLEFRDRMNRQWVFRYCYWKSSQSYVFTKGWNKFVKEMELRPKDTVAFYRCRESEGLMGKSFCMIDIFRSVASSSDVEEGSPMKDAEGNESSTEPDEEGVKSEQFMDVVDESGEKKEMKLFGVWIR